MTVLSAAVGHPAFAAKFTDREHTRIEEPRPADVPADEAMEAAGAVIGNIDIDIRNIFDQSDPRERSGLFRLADELHLRTKRATIRAQLLFASGDKYRARKLAETERALRLLRYVYDAHIVPVHYADGKVDVKVITKDVWTLSPGISFGRAGGTNATSFNLQDTNILGWGKTLQISHGSTVDRTSNTVAWTDPNVLGSHWTSAATDVDSSDGRTRSLQLGQPFYSLDTPWTVNMSGLGFDRTVSRYNLGNIVDQFKDNETSYQLSGGLSSGLVDGWVKRLTFGMTYDRNIFVPTPLTATPAKVLPPDRTLSYPFVGFDILQDYYKKVGDENEIGRTEDLYFGTEVTGSVGLSNSAFGADRNAVMLAATAVKGFELPVEQQLFLTGDFSTRIEEGRARNLIADAGAKYYWRWREACLLYAAVAATVTDSLDPDMQILLGGDNGLRGYPLRYESGTSRALVTVEQRFFTDWYPFRLARVGAAVFADAGRTWGSGAIGNSDPGLLRDVGFGLRLGNTRTGLGNVVHVDFAFPLSNIAGIQKFQFLVQTFQSF
ncbi:MAG: BamA/TamA family outer membrane protein [Steroidobacteraceae bacterium]